MASVLGLRQVLEALKERAAAALQASKASVIVGFTQKYAVFVHENLEAHHPVGQAKFLEQPARQNRDKYAKITAEQLKRGRTMAQALLVTGLSLQGDAQRLTPVDTGALRASAFTRLESKQNGGTA